MPEEKSPRPERNEGRRKGDAGSALSDLGWEAWFRGPKGALEIGLESRRSLRERETDLLAHAFWGLAFTAAGFAVMAAFFWMGGSHDHAWWAWVGGVALGLRVSGFLAAIWGAVGLMDSFADREEWLRMAKSWHERGLFEPSLLLEASKAPTPFAEALREAWEIGEGIRPGRSLVFSLWGFRYKAIGEGLER